MSYPDKTSDHERSFTQICAIIRTVSSICHTGNRRNIPVAAPCLLHMRPVTKGRYFELFYDVSWSSRITSETVWSQTKNKNVYVSFSMIVFRLDSGTPVPSQEWKTFILPLRQPHYQGSNKVPLCPAVLQKKTLSKECKFEWAKIIYTAWSASFPLVFVNIESKVASVQKSSYLLSQKLSKGSL